MTVAALTARTQALWHWMRGHRVRWRVNVDEPTCPGDIVCDTCDLVIWCRAHD